MDGGRHRLFGSHHQYASFAFPLVVLLVLLFPGQSWAADYTVSILPGQTFTSLDAAEAALHAASITTATGVVPGSDYRRTSSTSSNSTTTVYTYTVPGQPVTE